MFAGQRATPQLRLVLLRDLCETTPSSWAGREGTFLARADNYG